MIVITGTQRSGTSLIAKALAESGYDLGGAPWDEGARGGFEHKVACTFYRKYLGDERFPYDDFEVSSLYDSLLGLDLTDGFCYLYYHHMVIMFSNLLMNLFFFYILHGRNLIVVFLKLLRLCWKRKMKNFVLNHIHLVLQKIS